EPRDDRHTVARRDGHRLAQAVGRVVIGHGEHRHGVARGGQHQLARRERAVRGRRVRVEVDGAPAHAVRYVSSVRTATPVPPLAAGARSFPLKAGPAMPKCAHGVVPANSFKNNPAVMAPPPRGPTLLRSATSLLRNSRYSSTSGSSHTRSPASSAAARRRV